WRPECYLCVLACVWLFFIFFFFSSRRRHTRFSRDWSSDVCSSDLIPPLNGKLGLKYFKSKIFGEVEYLFAAKQDRLSGGDIDDRSEERRVGKECRSRWSP